MIKDKNNLWLVWEQNPPKESLNKDMISVTSRQKYNPTRSFTHTTPFMYQDVCVCQLLNTFLLVVVSFCMFASPFFHFDFVMTTVRIPFNKLC